MPRKPRDHIPYDKQPYEKQLQDKVDAEQRVIESLAPHYLVVALPVAGYGYETEYVPKVAAVGKDGKLTIKNTLVPRRREPLDVRYDRVITTVAKVAPQFFERKNSEIAREVGCAPKNSLEHLRALRDAGFVTQLPNKKWKANPLP